MAELVDSTEVESKQYIVVRVGSESYGIDIGVIDNIVRMQKITRVPKAQHYFKGIINLRGEIVPVMSIRIKMGLEEETITGLSRIIILKAEEQEKMGIIVDEVKEVVMLSENQIDRNAQDMNDAKSNFINGIGKNGDQLISLFELEKIIEENEYI